jgi:adenylosuccinate synthase
LSEEFGYHIVQTSRMLKDEATRRGTGHDANALRQLCDQLDTESHHRWIFDEMVKQSAHWSPDVPVVIDSIGKREQLDHFRQDHRFEVVHAHLYAPIETLCQRFARQGNLAATEAQSKYGEADILRDQDDVKYFKQDADVRIDTGRCDTQDTVVRVAARLGLYSPPDVRCVDVLIGGQYGSEGKGHIAAYLARDYDVLVRVGGPNAGHSASSASGLYIYHQLPSGTRDTNARVLLGPGMTINVENLLGEIEECKISPERLFIDPQAMIIEPADLEQEREMVAKIASTGRGGGSAAARRIMGRKPDAIRLARNIPALDPYVGTEPSYRGSTMRQLEIAYRENLSILLEGTQGSGLSLYHGAHPYVTSRDTNVAGCLAEAGISPSRVRRILMVVRPTPIRVANPDGGQEKSGPLKHEVSFREVAETAGLDATEVEKSEITSTTKRNRRVGWFEWEQFRQACALNAPTDIVLTFADYIDAKNEDARRFEQLTERTIKFIEELERVAHAPVSLVNTRFPRNPTEKIDLRTVIDRRNWITQRRKL